MGEPGSGGYVISIAVNPFDSKRVLTGGDMLGVGLSIDGGDSWRSATTGFKSWEMGAITWHPFDSQVAWIGSMSGPYKSSDGGLTWIEKRFGMGAYGGGFYSVPIEKILFDPANPRRLLAFGGSHRQWSSPAGVNWGGVWESTDDGESWIKIAQLGNAATGSGVMAASYSAGPSPYLLYAARDTAGIWQSADNGHTWQRLANGLPAALPITYVTADPLDHNTAYASFTSSPSGSPGGLWKTTDAGKSWRSINNGLGQLTSTSAGIASNYWVVESSRTRPQVLVTADLSWWNNYVYRSLDGGATWQAGTTGAHFYGGGSVGAFGLGFDPNNSNTVFMTTGEFINRSFDGGQTWSDVLATPASGEFWHGTGFSGLVCTNVKFNPLTKSVVLMGMDDGKWVESRDGMQTWRWGGAGMNHFSGGDDATFSQAAGGPQVVYLTSGQWTSSDGILRSADGGETWSYVAQANASGQPLGIYALPDQPDHVWLVQGSKLYASTTNGQSWTLVTSGGIDSDGGLAWIATDPAKQTTFYVNGAKGVWKTSDGVSFALMAGSPANTQKMIVDPTNPTRLYVTRWRTFDNDGLYKYDGNTWSLLRPEFALRSVDVDPNDSRRIIVSTDDDPYHDVSAASGVWLTEDGGATWTQQNHGLAMLRGSIIRFVPWDSSKVIFGTNGRGFWLGRLVRTGMTTAR